MTFEKRRVTQTPKTYKKRAYKKTPATKVVKKRKKGWILKFFGWFLLFCFVLACIGILILYKKYIEPLPSISELEKIEIAEATILYDRKGNEMYKVFEEKRTYQDYENISQNMVHAIIAWEDKRFFENPGVDLIGLTRAVIYRVTGKSEQIEGTSTLTQQLIRNMIITNERTAERKIKEMYLAYKLTNNLSKEKILELYLNKISFWSNAFGIEQAARTFFAKSSKELSVLEASMLASLPKWPSYYSPYNNFDRLVGYPYVYPNEDSESPIQLTTQALLDDNEHVGLVKKMSKFIEELQVQRISESQWVLCGLKSDFLKSNISIDAEGCSVIEYSDLLTLLNSIKIKWVRETIEYQTGRKDFILGRMLEDDYIDFNAYKQALLRGFWFEFSRYTEDIKYPHFVFYVREYLEKKYGKEILERGWLRVYTSLDPVLQDKAQEIVEKYWAINESKFATKNAAMVSVDNKTGQILTMVWGRDYFDEANKGNVNIITSKLQPGSTFKPFVYSIAIDKEIIGTQTPVYDLKTTFPGNYEPNNFDWKFKWKMTIASALNESRNIPAVKMYFLAGWEKPITDWMENLWVSSIREFKDDYFETYWKEYAYGASMWLWTGMMTPLELAWAYSVYANLWYKKEITPIVKILDARGLVIEEFREEDQIWELAIDPSTAYITNHMLKDTTARPKFWNTYLALSDRPVAAKTGTSTKQFEKNGEKIIYPRNLWTAWYTPQITTVAWAGNNDGSEANFKGNGLEWAGPMWKDFMEFYHSDEPVKDWEQPTWVKQVDISKLSWLLAPQGIGSLSVSSLFVNAPTEYGAGIRSVQVDLLCNGRVTELTPEAAKGYIRLWSVTSLRPSDPAWERPVQNWASYAWYASWVQTQIRNTACERSSLASEIEIGAKISNGETFVSGSNYLQIWYRSVSPISNITVTIWGKQVAKVNVWGNLEWVWSGNIAIPEWMEGSSQTMVVKAIDNQFFSQSASYNVNILDKDTEAPVITLTNPADGTIALYAWDFFNLRWKITDRSQIKTINIYVDGVAVRKGLSWRQFSQEISTAWFSEWSHTITVEAYDSDFNKTTVSASMTVLPGWRPWAPKPAPVPSPEEQEAEDASSQQEVIEEVLEELPTVVPDIEGEEAF